MKQPEDLISVGEAKDLLKVSTAKMSKIIRDGMLEFWTDPLDARVKLVSREQVEALKVPRRKAA